MLILLIVFRGDCLDRDFKDWKDDPPFAERKGVRGMYGWQCGEDVRRLDAVSRHPSPASPAHIATLVRAPLRFAKGADSSLRFGMTGVRARYDMRRARDDVGRKVGAGFKPAPTILKSF